MSSPSPSSFLGPRSTDRPKVPRTRAATWSHRETLDFLALWGEESIQAQLNRCHRNADVYQWISERMAEKGYFRDEDQCRTKGKDLKKSYKQAKLQDGVARQRCRFFHELDAILGGGGSSRGGDGILSARDVGEMLFKSLIELFYFHFYLCNCGGILES
uniref:Myb/SANT-like DNA-binding domain-containing protein n=1 Tax=Laticauda laticaudata TaxID=8630 RepID=A0A8C5SC49_LATLA